MTSCNQYFTLLIALIGLFVRLDAQDFKTLGKGKFYFQPQAKVLFCQIDGDGASGYNKIGYSLGVNTGFTLDEYSSLELGIGIAERGSQRGINPELGIFNPFHIRLNHLDTRISWHKWIEGFLVGLGVQVHYLISAQEVIGIAPNIQTDYKRVPASIWSSIRYDFSDNWALEAEAAYSFNTMVKTGLSVFNPLYPSGVYSNHIGIGVIFTP